MDLELCQYKVAQLDDENQEHRDEEDADGYKNVISEGLEMQQKKDCKILSFKQQVPKAAEGKH